MIGAKATSVEEYMAGFPASTQTLLQELRSIIKKTAPEVVESISYGMPAFKWGGKPLVYFAGYKNHVGFYPGASGISFCKDKISDYKSAKGSVQFPLDQPLPAELIKRILLFRVEECRLKLELGRRKK